MSILPLTGCFAFLSVVAKPEFKPWMAMAWMLWLMVDRRVRRMA